MKNKTFVYSKRVFILAIVILSLLACVKSIFFGLNIDEEYAVTMAYRMVGRDDMFYTMWDPHQTSGFLCAFFIKVFLLLTGGNTDYMIIYLRFVGMLIHAGVCVYVYRGLRHVCSKYYAFLLSVLCFSILPKWILVPEFSNMLLWVTLSIMASFLQIQFSKSVHVSHFIILGVLTCIGILTYPSFLLCFVVYCIAIYWCIPDDRKRALVAYISTCVTIGFFYTVFFVCKLGIDAFIKGIFNMATDGQHETPFVDKLWSNVWDLTQCICVYLLIYAVLYLLLRILKRDVKRGIFVGIALFSVMWQLLAWLGNGRYINEPLMLFYHIFLVVLMSCKMERKEVWCYIIPPVTACLAASILTNTGIYVISAFLLPAIIYGLACVAAKDKNYGGAVIISLLMLFLLAKGWLLCENEGYKADMTYVKQKALSGPAKNIYCRYLDGYEYNLVQELIDTYIDDGARVLCVSRHTIWYLLGDVEISNYSTISTPTFDERLLEYYDIFPEKYPDFIILQENAEKEKIIEMFQLDAPIIEREGICLYDISK